MGIPRFFGFVGGAFAFASLAASPIHADNGFLPLAHGLVAYYSFDGNLSDGVGSNDGVGKIWKSDGKLSTPEQLADHPLSDVAYTVGKYGQAVELDGPASQYIETPLANEDIFDFGAPDAPTGFTVSAWYRENSFTKDRQTLIAKGDQNRWRIHHHIADILVGNGGGGEIGELQDYNNEPRRHIHHIALVSNPFLGHVRLYVDGFLTWDGEGEAPNLENNPMPMLIGQNPETGNRTWDGLIDDVALWARPLTEAEVRSIAKSEVSLAELADLGGPTPGVVPGMLGEVMKADGGAFRATLPAGTFDVEYSTDLVTWTVIASAVSGTYEDTDASRNAASAGYYRAVAR